MYNRAEYVRVQLDYHCHDFGQRRYEATECVFKGKRIQSWKRRVKENVERENSRTNEEACVIMRWGCVILLPMYMSVRYTGQLRHMCTHSTELVVRDTLHCTWLTLDTGSIRTDVYGINGIYGGVLKRCFRTRRVHCNRFTNIYSKEMK